METKEQNNVKHGAPEYKTGTEVYLIAFLQQKPVKYYVCKAIVEKEPSLTERRVYKVKIIAVADKAIGGKKELIPPQASLLGRTITKRENELNKEMAAFMLPKEWITLPGKS